MPALKFGYDTGMSTQDFIIETLQPDQFAEAQAFYATMDYDYPISADSRVVVARKDTYIYAVVRISPEEGAEVLRGFMVHPDAQRQGLGTLMLHELKKSMGALTCYCLPHSWLEDFYGQIGFETIPAAQLPPGLYQRWQNLKDGPFPHVIAMRCPAKGEGTK